MNKSASHWIFVCLSAIQNQENCGFMRVWTRWNKVAQPFESSKHIELRSCFHIISAVPMKQYRWSFSSPKFILQSILHEWQQDLLDGEAHFLQVSAECWKECFSFFLFFDSYHLIGTLFEGTDKPYKMRVVCRWNSRDIWPSLTVKMYRILTFSQVFVTAGVYLVPAGFWSSLLHANNRI